MTDLTPEMRDLLPTMKKVASKIPDKNNAFLNVKRVIMKELAKTGPQPKEIANVGDLKKVADAGRFADGIDITGGPELSPMEKRALDAKTQNFEDLFGKMTDAIDDQIDDEMTNKMLKGMMDLIKSNMTKSDDITEIFKRRVEG